MQAFFVEDLAGNQPPNQLDGQFVELLVACDLYFSDPVLIVFLDVNRDVVAIECLLPKREWDAPRKRRPDKRKRPVKFFWLGLDDRIEHIGSDIAVLGIQHANASEVIRKLEI